MLNNIINQTETETENVFNTYLGGGGGRGHMPPLPPRSANGIAAFSVAVDKLSAL